VEALSALLHPSPPAGEAEVGAASGRVP